MSLSQGISKLCLKEQELQKLKEFVTKCFCHRFRHQDLTQYLPRKHRCAERCQVLRSGNSLQALVLSKKKQRDLRQTTREQFKLLMCLPYMMHAEALWHLPSGRFIFSSLNPKRMNLFPITVTKLKSCSLSSQPRSSVVVPERLHTTETALRVCCDSVPEFLLQVK